MKGAKKVKVEKVDAEAEAAGVTPKPKGLNKGQRARLTKLADQLEKLQEEWHSLEKNNDDAVLKAFLPQPLVESAQKAAAEVQACMAEVQVVLTEGWVGDPKKVMERVAAAAQNGLASNARLASMFKMAADMQGEQGEGS